MKIERSLSSVLAIPVLVAVAAAQTPNYVAKFTGGPLANSVMFDNGVNVGVGTNAPVTKLTLRTSATNDGVRVLQGGSTAASLGLFNSGPGAHNWALFSLGAGNFQGAGNFTIYDYTSARDRFFITGRGDVGVDTTLPAAKLHVYDLGYTSSSSIRRSGLFQLSSSTTPVLEGVRSEVTNLAGLVQNSSTAVRGITSTPSLTGNFSSYNYGVWGSASGGHSNDGGHFDSSSTTPSASNIAVYGKASGAASSATWGGYFEAYGGPSTYGVQAYGTGWAGYFLGNVYASGLYLSSDAKLKRDVQTLDGSLARIEALRPTSYRFRTDAFPDLGLPEGEQLGFLAQELERVFPELVKESLAQPHRTDQGEPAGEATSIKAINYTGLVPVLVGAVQEQQRKIREQDARLADLETRLATLAQALEDVRREKR